MNCDTHGYRNVLIAPDRLFRETLAARLTSVGLEVAQVEGDIHDVPRDILHEPGVILIVHVTQDDGAVLDMLRDVKRTNPHVKLLIVGKPASPATIAACLEIGVNTILDEDVSFDSFLNYLRFIALDEQVLPADMINTVLSALRPYLHSSCSGRKAPVDLTRREKVILAYLTEGASNKHIARYLGVADGTVKVGIKTILRKINANNRTQAAVWALQHDIRGGLLSEGVELNGTPSPWRDANNWEMQASAA